MILQTFAVGPIGCNCSIVADEESKKTAVIDPGGDLEIIQARLAKLGAKVEVILHTHGHVDHVGATAGLQDATGAKARMHPDDRFLVDLLKVQSSMIGLGDVEAPQIDFDLKDGETVLVGGLSLLVVHTPGHSPGSVCFVAGIPAPKVVFAGDTLFAGGIGRTDLWGGDSHQLQKSIRTRLFTLDSQTQVVPGHGPQTTIGKERETNPFVRMR